MSKKPFKISAEAQGNKAVIRISGYISSWSNHSEGFRNQLSTIIESGINDVDIYINSPGGSCFEANEIVNELIAFKGKKTAVLGAMCASAATYIMAKCNYVKAAKNNNSMIHKPWGVMEGNAAEIESQLKLLKNLQDDYAKTYSEKTGLSIAKIESMWTEDYWMNASEAKALGFIDEIDGEDAEITDDDVEALHASGYKNMPSIAATIKNDKNQPLMKDKLLLILAGFPGFTINATSSEEQILASVEALKSKAMKTDDLQAKLNNLTSESNKVKIESFLDKNSKRFPNTQRAYYKAQLERDFDGTKAHIESMPEAVTLTDYTKDSGGGGKNTEDQTNWTYADYQEKDPMALAALAENDPDKYERLFKANYEK